MTAGDPEESESDDALSVLIQGVPHISAARIRFNEWCFEKGLDPNRVLLERLPGVDFE